MEKIKIKFSFKHLIFYIIGIILTAIGVTLLLRGNLGVSPWDTLNYSFSLISNISYGNANFIISAGFTIFVALKEKKAKYLLVLIPIFLVTRSINLFNDNLFLTEKYQSIFYHIIFFTFGLITLALGAGLMIASTFPAGIYEELMLTIMRIFKTKNLALTRILMEIVVVIIAFIIGIIGHFYFGKINLGTVFISLTYGPLLHFFLKFLRKI